MEQNTTKVRQCVICKQWDENCKASEWLFGIKGPVCFYCFLVWRDENIVDTEEIRKLSLEKRKEDALYKR